MTELELANYNNKLTNILLAHGEEQYQETCRNLEEARGMLANRDFFKLSTKIPAQNSQVLALNAERIKNLLFVEVAAGSKEYKLQSKEVLFKRFEVLQK